jgi:NAD(P)-dependent dehydrogenase (short-subunit alcohol dehydrogenase family)
MRSADENLLGPQPRDQLASRSCVGSAWKIEMREPAGGAVVAGASGTLGRAITAMLVARGVDVLAVARNVDNVGDFEGPGSVTLCAADLGSDASVETIAAVCPKPLKMVVLATGLPPAGDIESLTPDEMNGGFNEKVGGLLRLLRATSANFAPGTRIVVLGGHYGAEPNAAAPLAGMANAALANVVRSLADRFGPRGVTAHVVAPGPVESPRMDAIAERTAAREPGVSPSQVLDRYRAASPLGRLTTPAEVAWGVCLFLDDESAAMTGSVLWLDAGRRRGSG